MHATNVEALFPSLEAKSSARICREEIKGSKLDVQNFEIEDALLYLMLNEKEYLDTQDLDPYREHLPLRKTTKNEGPSMKSEF